MHWLSPLFLVEAKLGTLGEKKHKKRLTSVEKNFSEEQPGNTLFYHKTNEEIL